MNPPYVPRISRRTTLQWVAAATAASVMIRDASGKEASAIAYSPTSKGYGTDPNLNHPGVTWDRVMTLHQLQLTAVIADLILPGTPTSPAPSALGVPDFVNEWVSAPYPEQQADRPIFFEGFEWVDAEAGRRHQRGFLEVDELARAAIIADVAHGATPGPNPFFRRLRYLVVGAYYTTPAGFKEIGYVGNVPIADYPDLTATERDILEERLKRLGL